MGEERAQHGRGVRENAGGVLPSAGVQVAGAGVMMRDEGDKEIRFASGLAVVGHDRSGGGQIGNVGNSSFAIGAKLGLMGGVLIATHYK